MALSSGTRLGPYDIVAPLGAGGMGEVYRARDTRLDRTVAIKILPEHLSADRQRRERFEREAKTISALAHPNICTLYDVGEQNGIHFLVLEYLEGETLADRLQKGALPVAEALKIGMEIAAALDAAHRRGVVHRDLKPANVILTRTGAKLLDFGLAKPAAMATGAMVGAPTVSKSLTEEGTIVGTFQYMAPEQLEGVEADARTDIFALGEILYEIATGKAPFEGRTKVSLIASILSSEPPPIRNAQPLSPPEFERVVRRCLAKIPDDRWQSAADLRAELQWLSEPLDAQSPTRVATWKKVATWAVVVVFAVIAAAIGALWSRPAAEMPVIRAQFTPAHGKTYGAAVISPDGTHVALICGAENSDVRSLCLLDLKTGTVQPLPGTEDAFPPAWSPDSKSLAFGQHGKLQRMELNGSAPVTITDISPEASLRFTWGSNGTIVFSIHNELWGVPSTGGTPARFFSDAESKARIIFPHFLPDGRHVIYIHTIPGGTAGGASLFVTDMGGSPAKFVLKSDTNVSYAAPGYLLFGRGGAIYAQEFNTRKLSLSGEPVVLPNTRTVPSSSDNGLLASMYLPDQRLDLEWIHRDDKTASLVPLPKDTSYDSNGNPRLSPDGRSVVVSLFHNHATEQWVLDLARGTWARLTFGEDHTDAEFAVWSSDGRRVAYALTANSKRDIAVRDASGLGEQKILLASPPNRTPTDWSRDGRYLLFHQFVGVPGGSKAHIGLLDLGSGQANLLFQDAAGEEAGRLSPNGRWLAYASDESGHAEVYAVPFPSPVSRVAISVGGGSQPVWRRDGGELYYIAPDQKLMAVSVRENGNTLDIGKPVALFQTSLSTDLAVAQYDVSADGKRFILGMQEKDQNAPPPTLTVLTNWTALLKK